LGNVENSFSTVSGGGYNYIKIYKPPTPYSHLAIAFEASGKGWGIERPYKVEST